ncbi:MAG TPA: GFA family protein [Polyangia bacterium]|nr:GFA family protein [Polyangia bacterium]
MTYRGSCFCGEVEITVTGSPAGMGYCHCSSCRAWSASPVNAFTLWPADAVAIVKGAEHVAEFRKTERSHRQWCRRCGGHLMAAHPQWKLIDVYAAVLPDHAFKPGLHVNYGERVLAVKDGLPKFKDLPPEMGGSGELLPE